MNSLSLKIYSVVFPQIKSYKCCTKKCRNKKWLVFSKLKFDSEFHNNVLIKSVQFKLCVTIFL